MEEKWKPITGYEGVYEISDHGRVRSLDRVVIYKNGAKRLFYGVMLNPVKSGPGTQYRKALLHKNGSAKVVAVHRLVAEHFIPRPKVSEGKNLVLHNDGDSDNNHVSNLRWGNHAENNADTVRHGKNNRAYKKLSREITMAIQASDLTLNELAELYDIHPVTVSVHRHKAI